MIVVNTDFISGKKLQTLSLVRGSTVHSKKATCQVKCNSKLEKISEGEFQLRHLRGR